MKNLHVQFFWRFTTMLQALKRQPFRFVLWETKLTGSAGTFLVYNQPPSFLLTPAGKWQAKVGAGISEDQESYQEGLNGKIIGSDLSFFILFPASDPWIYLAVECMYDAIL